MWRWFQGQDQQGKGFVPYIADARERSRLQHDRTTWSNRGVARRLAPLGPDRQLERMRSRTDGSITSDQVDDGKTSLDHEELRLWYLVEWERRIR